MKLTPLDIQKQEFSRVLFGGYKEKEIDEFMDLIFQDFSQLYRENKESKEKISLMEEKVEYYQKMEENIREALLMAQKAAEETINNARLRAENIIREAEIKAEKMEEEVKHRIRALKEELMELVAKKNSFILEFKTLLETYLKLLDENGKRVND